MREEPHWRRAFEIKGSSDQRIVLEQTDAKHFELGDITIRYTKKTGLEHLITRRGSGINADVINDIRWVDAERIKKTDLASVPAPLRWFTNTYGAYTPAALVHDWLIPNKGETPPIKEEYADRFFRYMLGAIGIRRFKRYIMWAAVALRTRWFSPKSYRRWMLLMWAVTSALGIVAFATSTAALLFGSGTPFGLDAWWLFAGSVVAPFACSILWWRQYVAGVVAALAAPWILPAAVLAAIGTVIYLGLETLFGSLLPENTARSI